MGFGSAFAGPKVGATIRGGTPLWCVKRNGRENHGYFWCKTNSKHEGRRFGGLDLTEVQLFLRHGSSNQLFCAISYRDILGGTGSNSAELSRLDWPGGRRSCLAGVQNWIRKLLLWKLIWLRRFLGVHFKRENTKRHTLFWKRHHFIETPSALVISGSRAVGTSDRTWKKALELLRPTQNRLNIDHLHQWSLPVVAPGLVARLPQTAAITSLWCEKLKIGFLFLPFLRGETAKQWRKDWSFHQPQHRLNFPAGAHSAGNYKPWSLSLLARTTKFFHVVFQKRWDVSKLKGCSEGFSRLGD